MAVGDGPFRLYAAVPAVDARGACAAAPGLRAVAYGSVAALVGKRRREPVTNAALRHDRTIGRVLEVCAAVVPFRFGIEVASELELCELVTVNLDALVAQLARLAGRVEMGLKLRLPPGDGPAIVRCAAALDRVRVLAPREDDRRERLIQRAGGPILEGAYLVARQAAGAFWVAIDDLRAAPALAGLPLLGSGPWAPYTFCDLALRPAAGPGPGRALEVPAARVAQAHASR